MLPRPIQQKKFFIVALISLATLTALAQVTGADEVSGVARPTPPRFLPAVTYDAGGALPISVVVADVNGDGRPDAVVANQVSDTVSVLLGNGDGTFQTAVTYGSGGHEPASVAVGDVNGDGRPDIVVANECTTASVCIGLVGVLLGNGDGTFRAAVGYSSGGHAADSIALADVNEDGKADLTVANFCESTTGCGNGGVGVLLGNGDGTFRAAVGLSSGGYGATSIAAADVNEDGKPDLVVGNRCASSSACTKPVSTKVGVLLGNGDGTFQAASSYNAGGKYAASVAIADLNGDGKPELIVVNGCASSISVCTTTTEIGTIGVLVNSGSGFYSPFISNSGGSAPHSVAVSDVDGDGKPDVVVANNNNGSVSVLLGKGNGRLLAALTYASGGAPDSVVIADVNGDGSPDLLTANHLIPTSDGLLGVLLNNTVFRKTSTALATSLNPSIYGQKVTFTATVTNTGGPGPTGSVSFTWGGTHSIGAATLNSIGIATLTKSNLNVGTYPLKAVYNGDANNFGSTSVVLNQAVNQTTSTAALTSSPNPSTVGQVVTFTAKITTLTVVPKGPVTFTAGNTTLGTVQLTAGKATLTTSSLSSGSTTVTATYNGDPNIKGSSASITQVIQ